MPNVKESEAAKRGREVGSGVQKGYGFGKMAGHDKLMRAKPSGKTCRNSCPGHRADGLSLNFLRPNRVPAGPRAEAAA